MQDYIRFAALGDSATCGVGDPVEGELRGWARILATAIGRHHHVSLCNLAVPGATVADVRHEQLREALDHRPTVASLVVGLNDVMKSTWDPEQVRTDLMFCAGELARAGTLLVTARFHDHTQVLGLPAWLARPMRRRIEQLNAIYDEVHEAYGVLRLDLAASPATYDRASWATDRLHPSELGHRALAREFAERLAGHGFVFAPPSAEREGGHVPDWRGDLRWMVTEGVPWVGRRARDLGPWAARMAVSEARGVVRPVRPAAEGATEPLPAA